MQHIYIYRVQISVFATLHGNICRSVLTLQLFTATFVVLSSPCNSSREHLSFCPHLATLHGNICRSVLTLQLFTATFVVLCWPCNSSRQYLSFCPHLATLHGNICRSVLTLQLFTATFVVLSSPCNSSREHLSSCPHPETLHGNICLSPMALQLVTRTFIGLSWPYFEFCTPLGSERLARRCVHVGKREACEALCARREARGVRGPPQEDPFPTFLFDQQSLSAPDVPWN